MVSVEGYVTERRWSFRTSVACSDILAAEMFKSCSRSSDADPCAVSIAGRPIFLSSSLSQDAS